jgi:Cu/Ag efflux protein CusF
MTMVFTAAKPKMLEGLSHGNKVRFTADKQDGTCITLPLKQLSRAHGRRR